MATWTIKNHASGEVIELSRDVTIEHPEWVHEQCGTGSEAELQAHLDQCHEDDFRGQGPDACGVALADTTKACGFYGTDEEVFYLSPSGRTWIVSSSDFDGIREIADLPTEAVAYNHLMTPDEAIDYCRQVEAESGESLVSKA